jgi:hypothetical protein
MMGATVVENVHAGVITSEPTGRFSEARARRHADDPELTKRPNFFPKYIATSFSN